MCVFCVWNALNSRRRLPKSIYISTPFITAGSSLVAPDSWHTERDYESPRHIHGPDTCPNLPFQFTSAPEHFRPNPALIPLHFCIQSPPSSTVGMPVSHSLGQNIFHPSRERSSLPHCHTTTSLVNSKYSSLRSSPYLLKNIIHFLHPLRALSALRPNLKLALLAPPERDPHTRFTTPIPNNTFDPRALFRLQPQPPPSQPAMLL